MNTATWLQSTPAVALIDYYLHSAQHGLPKQRAEANEAAIQRWIDDMLANLRGLRDNLAELDPPPACLPRIRR